MSKITELVAFSLQLSNVLLVQPWGRWAGYFCLSQWGMFVNHVLSRELNIFSFSSGSSTLYTRLHGVAFKSSLKACLSNCFSLRSHLNRG